MALVDQSCRIFVLTFFVGAVFEAACHALIVIGILLDVLGAVNEEQETLNPHKKKSLA